MTALPDFDVAAATRHIAARWDDSALPALTEYIRIPNKSPGFDPEWREHGYMDKAVALVEGWLRQHALPGMKVEVLRLGERTPLIVVDVPGALEGTILLYGHLDKQPEMVGWAEGLSPWEPVRRGDKLYGRGAADDGYAAFASLLALEALQQQGIPHARCVILIEASEESGSGDLPAYIDHLQGRLGSPGLVVCLDSGCANYDQMWCTTSLRGLVLGTLTIEVLTEGVHSGDASGVVPSSFRIARMLLERLEDADTGVIKLRDLHVEIPRDRVAQADQVAGVLADELVGKFPWAGTTRSMAASPSEAILNRTWRPFLSVTGAGGLPAIADAGNVLRPETALKLSLRVPPTLPTDGVIERLRALFETDPPYGAQVAFTAREGGSGWNAPPLAPWLEAALDRASRAHFGKPCMYMGEGGSIPFMGMLGERFPAAQFLITGVLGPGSNAHGPNEFLHVPTAKRLTACVAQVIRDHGARG